MPRACSTCAKKVTVPTSTTPAPRTYVAKARVAAPQAASRWTAKAPVQSRTAAHVAAIRPKTAYTPQQTAPALRHYLYGLDGRLLLSTPAGSATPARRTWGKPRANWRRF